MTIAVSMDGEHLRGPLLYRLAERFLRLYRVPIALGLVGLIVQSSLVLPIPLLQGWVLDQLVALRSDRHPLESAISARCSWVILSALAATFTCLLLRMAVAWRTATMIGRISQEVVQSIREALHQKLLRLPMSYFDVRQTGRLMARLTGDVGSLLIFMSSGSLQLVNDLILSLGIAVLLTWLQWRLALIAFVAVPLYGLNHKTFLRTSHRLSDQIRTQIASVYAFLSERISAVRLVRSFAQEPAELTNLDQRIDTHRSLSWAHTKSNALHSALAALTSGVGTVGVLTYGVTLVGQGRLTVGELLAFFALVGQLYNPIVRLTQFQATLATTHVSLERIFEVLDEPEPVNDHPKARPIRDARGSLIFRSVSFRYRPSGPDILHQLNLRIEPGMTVGVLGPSGAGKSTLLALAPRLYDVTNGSGTVLLDGQDIRSLRLSDLRRTIGLVPQQAFLFAGTIRSNLLYAAPCASEAQMWRALEVTDLATTINGFPLGLETPVGERGQTLSGGQRQRLALARAILADPTALLLDDCTSALDADTEARVRTSLAELRPGRTCVIVSHKVASVRRADIIVVLAAGSIIEQGTHSELLRCGGYYASTYEQQSRTLFVSNRSDS